MSYLLKYEIRITVLISLKSNNNYEEYEYRNYFCQVLDGIKLIVIIFNTISQADPIHNHNHNYNIFDDI